MIEGSTDRRVVWAVKPVDNEEALIATPCIAKSIAAVGVTRADAVISHAVLWSATMTMIAVG